MTITATLKSYNYDEKSVVVSVDDADFGYRSSSLRQR